VIEDAVGNRVTLDRSGIAVAAAGTVEVTGKRVEISAGTVQVDARTTRFAGTVQADTVIAKAVVTPPPPRGPLPTR
jgi:hypothetical protein